jgi:Lactonase, 7-bladed beta-propeller
LTLACWRTAGELESLDRLGCAADPDEDVRSYDPVRGAFIWLQTIAHSAGPLHRLHTTAEIRIHPDGHFLYATNRG